MIFLADTSDTLAEVRRIVEEVDTQQMHSCAVPFCEMCENTAGHHHACDEILKRIEGLK